MNKKARKLIVKHLDLIYTSSVRISKGFGLQAISLKLLEEVINLNKMKVEDSNEPLHDFIDKYNDMLDELYKSCEATANKVGSKHVSKLTLKTFIYTLKDNL